MNKKQLIVLVSAIIAELLIFSIFSLVEAKRVAPKNAESFRFKIDVKAEDESVPIFLLTALLSFYCRMGTGLMGGG